MDQYLVMANVFAWPERAQTRCCEHIICNVGIRRSASVVKIDLDFYHGINCIDCMIMYLTFTNLTVYSDV